MAVESYDLVTVGSDYQHVALIVWKRYRCIPTGIFELTLAANPHLAKIHKYTPFLPVGTQLRIPIDTDILKGQPQAKTATRFWETVGGKARAVFLPGSV